MSRGLSRETESARALSLRGRAGGGSVRCPGLVGATLQGTSPERAPPEQVRGQDTGLGSAAMQHLDTGVFQAGDNRTAGALPANPRYGQKAPVQ